MSNVSFEQLYGDDKNHALFLFLFWANEYLNGFGIPEGVGIDHYKADQLITDLRKDTFPAKGGFEAASPFKKSAYFYVLLHTINPFATSLSKELVGEEIGKFKHNVASLIGFSVVKNCLHGATITKKGENGENVVTLANPISVSKHFMIDFVEASDGIKPDTNFRSFALLFEALAYEANPGICYSKRF